MSAAAIILPILRARFGGERAPLPASEAVAPAAAEAAACPPRISPEIAFYRKYTEALLRRYLRCSMEAGKVPSLLGKEMFRSKVSSYRMESFEDIIIFIHDVERCLGRLDEDQQELIARITLQEYTVPETADLMGLNPKRVIRGYWDAVDRLTRIFLAVEMLHPQNLVKRQNEGDLAQVPETEGEES